MAGYVDRAFQLQPIEVTEVSLTSLGTTNIASHLSETGRVAGVFTHVSLELTDDVLGTPGTIPDVDLVLTIDGTTYTEQVYNTGCPAPAPTLPCYQVPYYDMSWDTTTSSASDVGNSSSTKAWTYYEIPYESSVELDLVVNTIATQGNIDVALLRSTFSGSSIGRNEEPPALLQSIDHILIQPCQVGATTTTIIDQTSEIGILHGIGFWVNAGVILGGTNCDLEVTIDGSLTTQVVYGGTGTDREGWIQAYWPAFSIQQSFSLLPSPAQGPGSETGDWQQTWYQDRYHNSLKVELACGICGVGGPETIIVGVMRSVDL